MKSIKPNLNILNFFMVKIVFLICIAMHKNTSVFDFQLSTFY